MAIPKLYGTPLSTAMGRVLAALYEKGLEFEFIPLDMKSGEHKTEPYLSLNPLGQVPAFIDQDLTLFESRAITMYIAHEYADKGTPLVPLDSKRMAIVLVWMEVEAHQFDPPAAKLQWELAYKPYFGMQTDHAVVEEYEPKLAKVLDIYETRLSVSKYIGGDCFTLADLNHLPTLSFLMNTPAKKLFESRPKVSAWVADITSRPSWRKAVEFMQQK